MGLEHAVNAAWSSLHSKVVLARFDEKVKLACEEIVRCGVNVVTEAAATALARSDARVGEPVASETMRRVAPFSPGNSGAAKLTATLQL